MNENIKNMLRDAFELEGLLMLTDSRDGEISEIVVSAIRDKIESLAADAVLLKAAEPTPPPKEEVITDNAATIQEEVIEEPANIEYSETATIDDTEIDNFGNKEIIQEHTSESEYVSEPVISSDNKSTEITEEEDNDKAATEEEPVFESDTTAEIPDDDDETITVDEAYLRNKSKDLRNAFSINDMFRFRRELFGNNVAEMTDAINLVDAMHSYDEAEDYFYNELGWDKESEEVAEFMTIIKNHFI